jgi:sugar lactone lactonase YvrE
MEARSACRSWPSGLANVVCTIGLCLGALKPTWAQVVQYNFSNFAGAPGASGKVDGIGSAARFSNPHSIAVDRSGNLYVADWWIIRKITAEGAVTGLAGSGQWGVEDGPASEAQFTYINGLAVDESGNLFAATTPELGCGTVRKISMTGEVTTFAGSAEEAGSADGIGSAARFNSPTGVAVDQAGNLYVADWGNNTIRKISRFGLVSTLAGQARQSGSSDGIGSAARFYGPSAVAVDSTGNIFVADTWNFTIRKITPAGMVTTLAGSAGEQASVDGVGSSARFSNPSAVAVDGAGNVFVADQGNFTIRMISPSGVVTTVGGSPGHSGSADGIGGSARFLDLNLGCIAADNAGNLYVADSQRVSKGMPIPITSPRFGSLSVYKGTVTPQLSGLINGGTVVIESSTNLRDWLPVQTNAVSSTSQAVNSPRDAASPARFLRAPAK